jgi:hypothetical protein
MARPTDVNDLRAEVYGREMRSLCMTPYDGPDPLGLGPSVCLIPDSPIGKHVGAHEDTFGRTWAGEYRVRPRSVTITPLDK